MRYSLFVVIFSAFLLTACGGSKTQNGHDRPDTIALAQCPVFKADSAMSHVRTQCDFGPRVSGTTAWQQCGDWIVSKFRSYGLDVEEQKAEVKAWNGAMIPCRNIVARLNADSHDRIVLCAHWDSRPWADNDPDEKHHHTAILGANDGASGVAVLLELARVISQYPATLRSGIDFICFDDEDIGCPAWAEDDIEDTSVTWCLGSQYWAQQAANNGYKARFGILFDMVGGRGSTFSMEGVSKHYAEPVVQMLWHIAHQIGYGQYFPLRDGGYVTDDHVAVNQIARVPCIDIVPYHSEGPSSFGPTWHTISDTPENIDPSILEAVGQSVLQLLYNDNAE